MKITPMNLGDVCIRGKKLYWGVESVMGALDKDLSTIFSGIDLVVGNLVADPDANASFAEIKKGAVAGHIDLKVWKPAALAAHDHDILITGGQAAGEALQQLAGVIGKTAATNVTDTTAVQGFSAGTPSFVASAAAKDVAYIAVGDPAA